MTLNMVLGCVEKIGSWIVRKFVKKEEIKTKHLNKIKEEVLNPFLDMLRLQREIDDKMTRSSSKHDLSIKKKYL